MIKFWIVMGVILAVIVLLDVVIPFCIAFAMTMWEHIDKKRHERKIAKLLYGHKRKGG